MEDFFTVPPDTLTMSTRALQRILKARHWPAATLIRGNSQFVIATRPDGKIIKLCGTTPHTTNCVAGDIANDKLATYQFLKAIDVPQPETALATDQNLATLLSHHPKIVVKPIDGAHGNGITTDLTDLPSAQQAARTAAAHATAASISTSPSSTSSTTDSSLTPSTTGSTPAPITSTPPTAESAPTSPAPDATPSAVASHVIAQQQLSPQSPEVRVICIDYHFIAAFSRIPAQVTGDGQHTVPQLIELENSTLRTPAYRSSLAYIDLPSATAYVKEHHLEQHIPAPGEKVQVVSMCNTGKGGTLADITDSFPAAKRSLAEKIARSLDLPVIGIDFLDNYVLEVNRCPSLYHFVDGPRSTLAVEKLVDYLERTPNAFPSTTRP